MKIRTKLIILTSSLVLLSILPISFMVSKYTREGIVKETYDVCKNLSRLISSFATEELILNSTFESTTKIVNELKEHKINGLLNLYILNFSGKYVVAMESNLVGMNVSSEELDFFRSIDELSLREKKKQNTLILQFSYPIFIVSGSGKLKVGLAVFEFDKRELFMPVLKIQELISYITFVSVFLGVIASFIVSGFFSKPIQELLIGIRIISSGNLDHTIEYKSSDEIGVLATEFNTMTSKIRETNSELKNLNEDLQTLTYTLENKISDGVREQQKYSLCLLEMNKSKTIERSGLESALKEVTEICARILKIGRCGIWKLNQTGDELKCLDLFAIKENRHEKGLSFTVSDFPKYFKYFKKEDILSAANVYTHLGIMEFNESYHKIFNIQSALDAPIRSGGRILGVISCEQVSENKDWTNEEENFISAISNILASHFESNERQEAYKELTEAKKEIEDLNQFTHLVNSLSNLNDIFTEVSRYTNNNYNITAAWLFLPDEKREYLYAHKTYSYKKLPDDKYNYVMNKKISLKKEGGGILYKLFQRKKTLYLRKMPEVELEIDREFAEILDLKSFLYVPLVRKGECVGIFCFSNFGQNMKLSKTEIHKISNRCSQIAGAVDTHYLLEQVEKARTETEKQKQETEELNKLIKSLNEDLDIKVIMQKVHEYIKANYNINYYGLAIVDRDKERIISIDSKMPDFVSDIDRERINRNSTKVKDRLGIHAFAFKTKKAFYAPRIRKSVMTPEELFYQETTKLESILIIPLILQNEPIGFLDLYNAGKIELSKEDIKKLSFLREQLAGIIFSSNLFLELQGAKNQADIEKGIAQVAQKEAETERGKSEKLLLNILPLEVANELKDKGSVEPVYFENATIMFTDFKGFTQIAEGLTPHELVKELDGCFTQFDNITARNNLEKLKTIGDAYMCAGGLPKVNFTHAINSCFAALEIQSFMNQMKELKQIQGIPFWELRLGIHSGPLMAGVVGEKKFAYDVWGDTVNIASRMESSGTPGRINISYATYELVKHVFDCEYRGEVNAKNKGKIKMYYLNRLQKEYSKDEEGRVPNGKFLGMYSMP